MIRVLSLTVAVLALGACKKDPPPAPPPLPTPDAVCKKLASFDKDKANAEAMVPVCAAMLESVKNANAEAYKCMAKCAMEATDSDSAKKCDDTCPEFKKALGM